MLELEVSFAAFGLILAGLCPVVVAEMKHVKKLESRFQPGVTYYIAPRPEPWTQKLAGTASVSSSTPSGSGTSGARKVNVVSITSPFAPSPTTDNPTVTVKVVTIP